MAIVGGPAKPLGSRKNVFSFVQYDRVRKRALPARASRALLKIKRSPSPIMSNHDEPPPLLTRLPPSVTPEPSKALRHAIIPPRIYGVTKPDSSFLPPPVPCSTQKVVGRNTNHGCRSTRIRCALISGPLRCPSPFNPPDALSYLLPASSARRGCPVCGVAPLFLRTQVRMQLRL